MNLAAEIVKLKVAAQVAPRRWQHSLEQLVENLESGQDWDRAVGQVAATVPELGSLLQAAGQAGQPADITLEIIRLRSLGRVAWQRFMLGLVYPFSLLVLSLLITSLVSMVFLSAAGEMQNGWPNMTRLNQRVRDLQHSAMGGLLIVGWSTLFASTVYFAASPLTRLKLVGSLPVFGRPYRWLAMSELLTRLSVFLRYQPVLDSALRLTADSFGQNPLSAIVRYIAKRTSQGEGLQNALHATIVSDARAGLALTLIQKDSIGPSTSRAAKLLEQMVALTCARLGLVVPALVVFVFAAIVWGTWISFASIFSEILRALT